MLPNKFSVTPKKIWAVIILSFLLLTVAEYRQVSTDSSIWKQKQITKMYDRYSKEFPEIPDISVQELKLLQQQVIYR